MTAGREFLREVSARHLEKGKKTLVKLIIHKTHQMVLKVSKELYSLGGTTSCSPTQMLESVLLGNMSHRILSAPFPNMDSI